MSNHRARTWDHRGSKPFGLKLLPLNHYIDGYLRNLIDRGGGGGGGGEEEGEGEGEGRKGK